MPINNDRKKRPKREYADATQSVEPTMPINDDRKKHPKREYADGSQSNDQKYTQRRDLRSGYLSIQSYIRGRRDEIAAANSKEFISIIDEVDGMHHLVNKPREQVSDAGALRDLASTLVTSIKVHNIGSVTPSLFVSSLISRFGKKKKKKRRITESGQILWKDIGLHASPLFMTFQGPCSMLGHMNHDTQPPKVLVTRKRSRSSLKEKKVNVKPKEIKDTVSKEKTDTEKIIATMFDILKTNKKVCLGNIVLNRISFAQTVENLFALSFLVKDGRVLITVDEKGSHYVSPTNAPYARMITSGKVAYSQFMFKFGFVDWKLMKDSVGGGCELMPHRMKVDSCGGCELKPDLKEGNSHGATITTIKMESRNQEGSHEDGNEQMFIYDKPETLLVYRRRGRRIYKPETLLVYSRRERRKPRT
ncbi:non-structural maintenance of chromosomes element 4 homolog B-like [Lactuca sativa]|uniref:Non-structural maintenance of chromosomes element 4 n=1 Tax=Lactuca sativa TaxID=4236 RepID=A0A9R1WIH0_LACSA|nr:non-structural maintenance of chromosomes element 4 homolog B-like [Lactuca sativa]KAJ0222758.1 hypothetical protein LSAT_V11C200087240 [Lactuca sativa]